MVVVSGKEGEQVTVADGVTLTLLKISSGSAQLGIVCRHANNRSRQLYRNRLEGNLLVAPPAVATTA